MKRIKFSGVILSCLMVSSAWAGSSDSSLESQLQGLDIPENQAPAGVNREKLYSVQNRYNSLKNRSEVSLGGSYNFGGSGYLSMTQVDLHYRFHLNDRWDLGVGGSYAFNSLNTSGKLLVQQNGLMPDVAYPKYKANVLVGYNTFYGKIRFSMDSVTYFDQYVAIGPGIESLNTGSTLAGIADVGFVFWMDKWGSLRIGLQNELFTEKRVLSSSSTDQVVGHVDLGVMFGGKR